MKRDNPIAQLAGDDAFDRIAERSTPENKEIARLMLELAEMHHKYLNEAK